LEQIIKVDIEDRELGHIEKLEAHRTPILHRAFSVFLVDGDYMLIQKRAFNKYHSGGLWANSCCSHPRPGKSFLESVYDRIELELGITEKVDLEEIFNFTYLSKYAEDLYEYEFDHVLVGEYPKENLINFNAEEIEEVQWVKIDELKKDMVENPKKYSTWFIICAPKVFKYLNKNKKS
jgi:isopentenyl-diphosphate delta-isomerase